jgi:dienelactone hydrolase
MSNITPACCSKPAPASKDYTLKGSIKPYGSFEKAYIVGPTDSKRAIVFVYDIFGYYPQTQQGADILADRVNALVIMPDFAHGKPFDLQRYDNPPPDAKIWEEVSKDFFAPEVFSERVNELREVAKQLKSDGKTFVGAIGLCWGGRLVLTGGESETKELDAVASSHPAKLDESDGQKLPIPVALFPSKQDQIDIAEKIVKENKAKPFGGPSDFKPYLNMHHGWTGAHAYLDREDNLADYQDVYGRLTTFFNNSALAISS